MNVLILGSGGREHAFAWKISQSPKLNKLYVAPGNAGTAHLATNLDIDLKTFADITAGIIDHNIDLLIIGPEQPLVDGLRNYLAADPLLKHLMIIGPDQEGAKLEGSKAYAKAFMLENKIPTAAYYEVVAEEKNLGMQVLDRMEPPYVIKADGLAAGKGVVITEDLNEAKATLEIMLDGQFGDASHRVILESFLDGIEFSVFALTDGDHYVLLPIAKDYKRIGIGDTGPNTGGMGAVSPVSFVDDTLLTKVKTRIVEPTIQGLQQRGIRYQGFIFFGLIKCHDEPYVIEYNCRMGDPETQVVLPRIKDDLLTLLISSANGELTQAGLELDSRTLTNVVLASGGYPARYEKNKLITIPAHLDDDMILLHAGTHRQGQSLYTNGGRVMSCCAFGPDLKSSRTRSLKLATSISFQNKYFRSDIGRDLLKLDDPT